MIWTFCVLDLCFKSVAGCPKWKIALPLIITETGLIIWKGIRCIPYDFEIGYNFTTIELCNAAAFVGLTTIGMLLICCRAKGKADHIELFNVYRTHYEKAKKEENFLWKKNTNKPKNIEIPAKLCPIIGESANIFKESN
jgi:hypothetical protein